MKASSEESQWQQLHRSFPWVPVDLVAGAVYVPAVLLLLLSGRAPGALETAAALPAVLFWPGYALVLAFQPHDGQVADGTASANGHDGRGGGIDGIERLALSFGVSVAIIPFVALASSAFSLGLGLVPMLVSLSVVTAVGLAVGTVRRWRIPRAARFSVPVSRWARTTYRGLFGVDSNLDRVLNVVLAVAVIATVVSFGAAVLAPASADYSQFALMTENETGATVTGGYPQEMAVGEPASMIAVTENHRDSATEYTVVVQLHQVRQRGDSTQVVQREELARQSRTVSANQTWQWRHEVTPTFMGTNLRVTYLFYEGDVDAQPTIDSADDHAFFWANVTTGLGPSSANESAALAAADSRR